jgi:hypothetical protein
MSKDRKTVKEVNKAPTVNARQKKDQNLSQTEKNNVP